jgi:hypothetical protein
MAWTTPKAWAGSEVLTSADMNKYVGSNTNYLNDNKPTANVMFGGTVAVAKTAMHIECGSAVVNLTTANDGSTSITFNTAFGSAPIVVTTVNSNNASVYNASVQTIGTRSFVMVAGKITSGTATGPIGCFWQAIGA